MPEPTLLGRRVLIVEDEYLLADDLRDALLEEGADVLGPVASIDEATILVARELRIDAAVLDINLRGDMVFPIADTLIERQVPFAFATGYDASSLPERFASIPCLEKPLRGAKVAATLAPLIVQRAQ
jgi:DNA-binding NarL/FixJ family response regulator